MTSIAPRASLARRAPERVGGWTVAVAMEEPGRKVSAKRERERERERDDVAPWGVTATRRG